jgi:NhaP-type Na+/H+ or K+/H+ antiporter
MGWFGPRGLASVVFTLLAVVELGRAGRPMDVLVAVAAWTILLSVVAHGISAQPLAAWYSRRLETAVARAVEFQDEPARGTTTSPRRPSDRAPRGHTTPPDSPSTTDTNLGAPV